MFTPVKHGIVPQIWQYLSPNYRAPDMPKIRINQPTFQSQSRHKLQKIMKPLNNRTNSTWEDFQQKITKPLKNKKGIYIYSSLKSHNKLSQREKAFSKYIYIYIWYIYLHKKSLNLQTAKIPSRTFHVRCKSI